MLDLNILNIYIYKYIYSKSYNEMRIFYIFLRRRYNIRKILIVIKIELFSAFCVLDLFCLFLNDSDESTEAAAFLLLLFFSKKKQLKNQYIFKIKQK